MFARAGVVFPFDGEFLFCPRLRPTFYCVRATTKEPHAEWPSPASRVHDDPGTLVEQAPICSGTSAASLTAIPGGTVYCVHSTQHTARGSRRRCLEMQAKCIAAVRG